MEKLFVPFTKEALDRLEPKSKDYYIKDTKTPFLSLRVYNTGFKSFILNRRINDGMQKIKIGRYDCLTISQARNKAKELNAEIELGYDPKQERIEAKQSLTFIALYEVYYSQHAVKFTKGADANKKTMEKHIFPIWGKRIASKITSTEARAMHDQLGEKISMYSKKGEILKSHTNANRIMAIVSAVFNFGLKEGLIKGENPCAAIKKFRSFSRDRFLSLDELQKFMSALTFEDKIFSDLYKVLLYTGARKGNVLSMQYRQIDFNLKRWRLPETQTKNKEVNIIQLSEPVHKILIARDAFNEFYKQPSIFVFPGNGKKGHLNDPKKSFNRIRAFMKVDDIRIHDLRRTLGSYMAINGASLPIIGKALNHKSQVSTAIYARLSNDPVLEAVNAAAIHMAPDTQNDFKAMFNSR